MLDASPISKARGPVKMPRPSPTTDRYRLFGRELDALRQRTFDKVGAEDVRYVKRLNVFSRCMEVIGRVLIHISMEPVTFSLGVLTLWIHKQLQAMEIGHTALHGAYDALPEAKGFWSKTFRWETPIDEESWRYGHNVRHHGQTNVAGKDPDIEFGPVRITEQTPHSPEHLWQVLTTLGLIFPNFGFMMNLHLTGVNDPYYTRNAPVKLDPEADKAKLRDAWKKALRKYVPYYFWSYIFFPALAGAMFWKVMLGNYLAELMRDLYSAATIYCGHVGENVKSYPEGTRSRGRGEWYAMQVEAANNFKVSLPVSVLCGGLDHQIEHHLFPTLPPPRLREIAPEVRAICERHGVEYKSDTWGRTLYQALAHVARLSRDRGARETMRALV